MRHKILLSYSASLLLTLITGCNFLPEVEEVRLSATTLNIVVGSSSTLTATVLPEAAEYEAIMWKSSDPSVASVSGGTVTGLKVGKVSITATAEGVKSLPCEVNVMAIHVTGVSLNKNTLELTEGETFTLTPTVSPSNATDRSVKWSTSDYSVASVSSNGLVTAKVPGTATITVMSNDGGKTASCQVTVNPKVISVTGVTLSQSTLSLTEGETSQLQATVSPSNATNMEVKWSSSNTSVATVDSNGKVTAKSAGTATITARTTDQGKTATCQVTVKTKVIPVTGVALSQTSLQITEGEIAQLTATVSPNNATNKEVRWSSSNTSVATVDNNGKVTAKSAGTAIITARTTDQGKTATCQVTVKALVIHVNDLILSQSTASVVIGKTVTLVATVKPDNATNKRVTWSSSNPSIARVTNDGVVTGMAEGSATITCTTEDGAIKRQCYVTVTGYPTYFMDGLTLNVGSSFLYDDSYLKIMLRPFKWESSNTTVATVDDNGLVTGRSPGTAKITCTANDGAKGVFTVTVIEIVTVPTISFIPQSSINGMNGFTAEAIRYIPRTLSSDSKLDSKSETWVSANSITYYTLPVLIQYYVSPSNYPFDNKWIYSFIYKDVDYVTKSGSTSDFSMSPTFQSYSNGILSFKADITGQEAINEKMTLFSLKATKDGVSYYSDNATLYTNYYRLSLYGLKTSMSQVWTEGSPNQSSYDVSVSYRNSLDLKSLVSVQFVSSIGSKSLKGDNQLAGYELGLIFEVVKNYKIGSPSVDQSDYVTINGGVLSPRFVYEDGRDAIGRTPIIRVKLVHGNEIVSVGYIKVYISS